VASVDLDLEANRVQITLDYAKGSYLYGPVCGQHCEGYDRPEDRPWRHLDTMQFETRIGCRLARCRCPEHGVKTVAVPWADKGIRFYPHDGSFCGASVAGQQQCAVSAQAVWDELASARCDSPARGRPGYLASPIRGLAGVMPQYSE